MAPCLRSGGSRRALGARPEEDQKAGWTLAAHLHNHPFQLDRPATDPEREDIGGAVAPSLTDVHFYKGLIKSMGLRGSRITNGFHTLALAAAEIAHLRGRD